MKDNINEVINDDTVSTVEATPEEEPVQEQTEERLFTQKELNEIIQRRVQKMRKPLEKETSEFRASADKRTQELNRREALLNCREYLITNQMPSELLDIIDTSDYGVFKQKVEALRRTGLQTRKSPEYNREQTQRKPSDKRDPFSSATDSKHTPRKYY